MMEMKFRVGNPAGLHTRPAGAIAQAAGRFSSDITLSCENGRVCNAKSIIHMSAACIKWGAVIVVTAIGPDEEAALATMKEVLQAELGGRW